MIKNPVLWGRMIQILQNLYQSVSIRHLNAKDIGIFLPIYIVVFKMPAFKVWNRMRNVRRVVITDSFEELVIKGMH